MIKENLYRAKYAGKYQDFKDKFIFGDLVTLGNKQYIHPQNNTADVSDTDLARLLVLHPIDPTTIARCSYVPDKNSKLIFEYDKCIDPDTPDILYIAKWDSQFAKFYFDVVNRSSLELIEKEDFSNWTSLSHLQIIDDTGTAPCTQIIETQEFLTEPLTHKQILEKANLNKDNSIEGIIKIDLSTVIDNDLKSFLDMISTKLTNSPCLMDVNYAVVGCTKDNCILLRVSGDASEILDFEDES